MIDPWHIIWNVIYNARSIKSHPPTSPNTAPATPKNLMIDPPHPWNVIYNARNNRSHRVTSPHTAPATQNESHQWSASHMKRHLQWAEQVKSPFKLTKYCACPQKESHDWSASHMKRHLQWAEQVKSPFKLTLSLRFGREIPQLLPPI